MGRGRNRREIVNEGWEENIPPVAFFKFLIDPRIGLKLFICLFFIQLFIESILHKEL